MASLRQLTDIPIKYRRIFSGINQFNHVQSVVFDDVIKTKNHIVVSAPTGSGKTKIFELAIVELLMSLEQTHYDINNVKIIYVAPTKALCNEVFTIWREKFVTFDLNVTMATGDSDPAEMADLSDLSAYQIVITTPEKFDAMTRKWRDHCSIANAVRLVLIDEVHLVGDTHRGATLEAIVSRIKSFPQIQQIRFISASAWIPNIEDIAQWLNGNQSTNCTRTFQIEESKRSVPVSVNAIGYPYNGNSFQFNANLTNECAKIVRAALSKKTPNKQILIFCQSRNDVESSLNQLMRSVQLEISGSHRTALKSIAESMKDEKLKTSIANGFAYHHAGLSIDDRQRIETAYRDGFIKILLSTNTLAMGVNLPAHTVIIKSTERYTNGQYKEMPESLVLQMIGRAGRQQYNSSGCVLIMTKQQNVDFYRHFVAGSEQIESHLSNKLAELLNAEIVLNTINDTESSVMQWIRTTFFYTRMCKKMTISQADANVKECCQRAIQQLQGSALIECTSHGGISSRPFGVVMAKYFLSIRTMNTFRGFKGIETIQDILDKMVHCMEWSEFYVRRSERKHLNELNEKIQYRIPSKITEIPQKVSCLLQAVLGHVPIATTDLQQDADKIVEIAQRMVNSLIDYFQTDQFDCNSTQMGRYNSVLSAVKFGKSLKMRHWYQDNLRQILNLSESDVNKLISSGIQTVDVLMKTNPREIEDILHKDIPFGNELIDEIAKKVPCYDVYVNVMANHVMFIRVTQSNIRYEYTSNKNDTLMLIVGDSCNRLILSEDIRTTLEEYGFYEKLVSISSKTHTIFAHVIHPSLVVADKMVRFKSTDEKSNKSSNSSEMIVSSTQSTSPAVPTNISNDTLPSKVINEQNAKKTFQSKRPISTKSTSSHWTNRTDLMNQSTLSQYYNKSKRTRMTIPEESAVKSVFDAKRRVEPIKNIIHSPELFSTPSPTQHLSVPEQLYDFVFSPDSTSSNLNIESNIQEIHKENEPSKKISPPLVNTPIQSKINEQCRAQSAINGFVSAKAICKKDLTNDQGQSSERVEQEKPTLKNPDENCQQPLTDDDASSQIDEEFIDLICDELNELHSESETRGMINSIAFKRSKRKSGSNILQDLKLNNKNYDIGTIHKDFEDENESSIDLDIENKENMNTKNQESFFSLFADTEVDKGNQCDTENDKVKRAAIPKGATTFDRIMSLLPAPKKQVHPIQTAPKQQEIALQNMSQASSSSTRAVCGSQIRQEPSPKITSRPVNLKRSLDCFNFVPPRQLQTPNCTSVTNQSAHQFLAPDSLLEPKRARLSIPELLAKKLEDKEYPLNGLRLPPMPVQQRSIGKPSLKNTFVNVNRPSNKMKYIEFMKQCGERLKTDPNYKQKDFDLDYIRSTVLKLTPPQEKVKPKPCSVEKTTSFDESNDDGDFNLSQFDMTVSNQGKNQFIDQSEETDDFVSPDDFSAFLFSDL